MEDSRDILSILRDHLNSLPLNNQDKFVREIANILENNRQDRIKFHKKELKRLGVDIQ